MAQLATGPKNREVSCMEGQPRTLFFAGTNRGEDELKL
jgi:hypothetical protein